MFSLFFLPSARAGSPARAACNSAIPLAALAGVSLFGALSENLGLLSALGTVFMYVVLTQAWNILGGYAGYLNFGMVTFFGVGAYTTAMLFQLYGLSPLLTAPVG